jgi:hypothetical protein
MLNIAEFVDQGIKDLQDTFIVSFLRIIPLKVKKNAFAISYKGVCNAVGEGLEPSRGS